MYRYKMSSAKNNLFYIWEMYPLYMVYDGLTFDLTGDCLSLKIWTWNELYSTKNVDAIVCSTIIVLPVCISIADNLLPANTFIIAISVAINYIAICSALKYSVFMSIEAKIVYLSECLLLLFGDILGSNQIDSFCK